MTESEYLQKIGLTKRQIAIYLDLITHSESTVVDIHRRISMPRSTVYHDLDQLIENGFVISKKVGKTTVFNTTDPKLLKLKIGEEEQKLNELSSNFNGFINSIEKIKESKTTTNSINIYKGQAGIKQLLWNILTSKCELLVGFSPGKLENVTDREFSENWRREFRDRNMYNKIIFNIPVPLTWSDVPRFLDEHVEAKSLDPKKIKFDRMTLIYNDVLTIMSQKNDENQYGIEIRDELLVQSHMQLFDFLWDYVAEEIRVKG